MKTPNIIQIKKSNMGCMNCYRISESFIEIHSLVSEEFLNTAEHKTQLHNIISIQHNAVITEHNAVITEHNTKQ
jgi:hypothetical protein